MNKTIILGLILALLFVFAINVPVMAFDPAQTGITTTADESGFDTSKSNLTVLVGNVINGVLALIGLVLLIIVIYGGMTYMLAGHKTENVNKGKSYITNGIIGIIIIGLAYAISTFVLNAVIKAQG